MKYNYEAFGNNTQKLVSYTGNPLNPLAYLNPCGKIAQNYFTDYFRLYSHEDKNTNRISINETGIAYIEDRQTSYKREMNSTWTQWIDVQNEHFIVWMNMETFSQFYKKWGSVSDPLNVGSYMLEVDYNWETNQTGVLKSFVISSSQALGSASFFGWALINAAFFSFFFIIVLCVTCACQKSKFVEEEMSWE